MYFCKMHIKYKNKEYTKFTQLYNYYITKSISEKYQIFATTLTVSIFSFAKSKKKKYFN